MRLRAFLADLHFFRLFDFEVANVFDSIAELFDARLKSRAAQSGGAHIHAAAALAEVHRHADDANLLGHVFRDPCSVIRVPCGNVAQMFAAQRKSKAGPLIV